MKHGVVGYYNCYSYVTTLQSAIQRAAAVLAGVMFLAGALPGWAQPCCPDNGGVKYLQPPDLVNGVDVNATFSPTDPIDNYHWVLADDFPCTNSGPITDIHLWGSWLNDQVDANAVFTLAIWSDAPTSAANQFSHPDQLLWTQTYSCLLYTSPSPRD